MTTLREAAQQALEEQEQAEPVAWMVYTLDGKSVCVTDNPADFAEGHRALPLYTHPPRRETEQEPVAWVNAAHLQAIQEKAKALGLTLGLYGYVEIYTNESQGRVPLYTHPPRRHWVSLTDEEIVEIVAECAASAHRWDDISVARAVEQALRSKNDAVR